MSIEPEQPQQQANSTHYNSGHSATFSFVTWCFRMVGYLVILGLGGAYGVGAYGFFSRVFPSGPGEGSGLMLVSFVVGVPLMLGVLVGYIARRRRGAGYAGAGLLSTLSIAIFFFAAGTLFREGSICIVMAAPLFIVVGIIGAIIGAVASSMGGSRGPKLLSVAILVPAVMGPLESRLPLQYEHQMTIRSIYIAAPAEVIWKHLNYPLNIKPDELQGGFAYHIGVPYPIEARTIEGRVGGMRELRWQRGVSFQEQITDWIPNQYIAWKYQFGADSFPPGSLDDHILIGGRYFKLDDTSYTLTPEGSGTRLSVQVGSSVTTNFNWYAGTWAKFLIGDTAETILRFYKQRSEHPELQHQAKAA
ncbi:SRPBCC domain-containing protein [Undibacterium sp.]|uniref:SRPBCC domain-containing protein n=1 Tax=Undibacterium sp. TaxID=1914977 RepID=UPI00374CA4D5